MIEGPRPIYEQIAAAIENSIIDGSLAEGAQAPSTNELSAFYRINPATAGKGVNQLVTDGVLHKRRGIGMFVSEGARQLLRQRRREEFHRHYVRPFMAEARKLGIEPGELKTMIDDVGRGATP